MLRIYLCLLGLLATPSYAGIATLDTNLHPAMTFGSSGLQPTDSTEKLLTIEHDLNSCPSIQCPALFDLTLFPSSVGSVFVFDSSDPNFNQVIDLLNNYFDVLLQINPTGSGEV
jgi:hypothetical protein